MQTQKIYKPTEKLHGNSSTILKEELEMGIGIGEMGWGQLREVATLMSLGVEKYEIQYLMHLKKKEGLRRRWEEQGKHRHFF
jgi:hypothetical protein